MTHKNNEDEFLRECDSIRKQFIIRVEHADYLKNIDPDNDSRALRIIIEKHMNNKKMEMIRQSLLYIVFFMLIIVIALLTIPIL